jgi:hypothetical protein
MNPKSSQPEDWRTLWRSQPDDHPLLVRIGDNVIGYYDNTNDRTTTATTGTPGETFVSFGVNADSYQGTWRMYTLVGSGGYRGSTKLYIDETLVGTVNRSFGLMTHDRIGSAGGSQQFGGIAEVMVYQKELSLSEVQSLYTGTKARYGK